MTGGLSGNSAGELLAADGATLLAQLEAKYLERGQAAAWALEAPIWDRILASLRTDPGGIRFNYEIERVLGVGGAGAVFRVIDRNLYSDLDPANVSSEEQKRRRSYRALKIPRPHLEKGPSLADSLLEEISRLTTLTHPNVVSLFAKGMIPIEHPSGSSKWPWYVMSYIPEATDLDQLCKKLCPSLPELLRVLHQSATALAYIHRNGVVHCDFKPANIFLSESHGPEIYGAAVLADFGYAKHTSSTADLTTIGFTDYFAHPELQYQSMPSSQVSRTFARLPRSNVRPAFDLFAFGMTIHYLLDKFYRSFGVYRRYSYEIKYLRLCAARLLDGLNHQRGVGYGTLPDYSFRDLGTPGTESWIPGLRYHSAEELENDLAKLLGLSTPEAQIPELIETRRENIQVSDAAPTVYTQRLRAVVDHPLVRRLGGTSQLGLVSLVYPGATHSRLEHALGVFGVTAKYLRALYNDSLDPLFRQIVGTQEMKATLLAGLLHDIGQYPLAHDLEDVSSRFFSHEKFGEQLLSIDAPAQPQVQLFKEIGKGPSDIAREFAELVEKEWGVPLGAVSRILQARNSEREKPRQRGTHIERLCKSIIDGPIDVDKVDYLRRDSQHCNVQYGSGIDVVRLSRCLTVAQSSVTDGHLLLVVGVHEKGRISAESILWTRYAMLTQIYWHHTMRAIKALLHVAAGEILSSVRSAASFESLRQEFFRCAVLGEPVGDRGWDTALHRGTAAGSVHPGDLRVLGWLWLHTSALGKEAVEHILHRRLFKRLVVIYRSELNEEQRTTLDRAFKPDNYADRLRLRVTIERALLTRLKAENVPDPLLETEGYSREEWTRRMSGAADLRCLVDYPALRPGASFGLRVVRQWGERPPSAGQDEGGGPSEVYPALIPGRHFRDGMRELNKSIACLRILWRPEEYTVFKEVLGDAEVRRVVIEEIDRFVPEEVEVEEEGEG